VAQELVDQVGTAVHQQLAARLRLELRDLARDVARDDRRVVPVGPLQRVGDDVFRDAVHALGQLRVGFPGSRPEGRPDLPRPTAQQERTGGHRLALVVDLIVIGLEPECPGVPATPMLVEPGRLDDPVERHERRHDQLHG
jgi:hypothetical protein